MNDYIDFQNELMHFGVLGMKWGIRRYQPYSTTGPRKGGATGKEIGAAAKAKMQRKEALSKLKSDYKAQKKGDFDRFERYRTKQTYRVKKAEIKETSKLQVKAAKAKENKDAAQLKRINDRIKTLHEGAKDKVVDISKLSSQDIKDIWSARHKAAIKSALKVAVKVGVISLGGYSALQITNMVRPYVMTAAAAIGTMQKAANWADNFMDVDAPNLIKKATTILDNAEKVSGSVNPDLVKDSSDLASQALKTAKKFSR